MFLGCLWFIDNIAAQQTDSNGSPWCLEIHPNGRLSDVQAGQTTQVHERQHFLSVRINCKDILIQG